MKITTFIDRPILAGVISVLIFILGIIGLTQLSIEQFPDIAPPTVSVSATYSVPMLKPFRRVSWFRSRRHSMVLKI